MCLPNCRESRVISLNHVLEKMEQLEQSLSFKMVHEQFSSGDHASVADKLLPLVDQDAESSAMIEVCIVDLPCLSYTLCAQAFTTKKKLYNYNLSDKMTCLLIWLCHSLHQNLNIIDSLL